MKKNFVNLLSVMFLSAICVYIPAVAEDVVFKEQEINKDNIVFKEQKLDKDRVVFKEQKIDKGSLVFKEQKLNKDGLVFKEQQVGADTFREQKVDKDTLVFTEQQVGKADVSFIEQEVKKDDVVFTEQDAISDRVLLLEQKMNEEEELQEKTNIAFRKGIQYLRMKSYDLAMSMFNEALSYNPKLSDAYYNIASIYVAKKDYDEAYNNYVKAIALNPRDYDAILQAAKISYNRGNYSLALKYLNHIPDDYEKYFLAQRVKQDAQEQFDIQSGTIERSKISSSTPMKHIIIDKFNSPAGMVVDSKGNMYVASYSDNAIIKVDKNKVKTTLVKDYLLEGPVGLAIDKYDNIYVANFDANNILKITKGGIVTIFMERIAMPYFLYIKDDILYVSEQGNNVVLTYDLSDSEM